MVHPKLSFLQKRSPLRKQRAGIQFRFEKNLLLAVGHFLFSIAALNLVSSSQSKIENDQ
jgi:hypothetical protein